MSDDQQLLRISNKVHVLETEMSHLQARVDALREQIESHLDSSDEEYDALQDEIEDLTREVAEKTNRIENLEKWIQEEEKRRERKEKEERRREFERWSTRRKWVVSILITLAGADSLGACSPHSRSKRRSVCRGPIPLGHAIFAFWDRIRSLQTQRWWTEISRTVCWD